MNTIVVYAFVIVLCITYLALSIFLIVLAYKFIKDK